MTQVVPINTGRIIHSLTWSGDPQPMAMTYGVAPTLTSTLTPQEIVDAAATAFAAELMAEMGNVMTLTQTELHWQAAAPPADPEIYVSTVTGTGGNPGPFIPQNTAILIHKRSALGGRGHRGRLYSPAVEEGAVDNLGNLTGGQITAVNGHGANFLAAINDSGAGFDMVIFHDSAATTAGDPPDTVVSLTCDPVIATQRRRLRR